MSLKYFLQTPTTDICLIPCFLIPFKIFLSPSDMTVVAPEIKHSLGIIILLSVGHFSNSYNRYYPTEHPTIVQGVSKESTCIFNFDLLFRYS